MSTQTIPIPKHLDDPPRLIFWTIDEVIIFLVPFTLLVIGRGMIFSGLIISITLFWLMRKIKQDRGHAFLLAFLYWHLPGKKNNKRLFCPSHIREYIS